MWSASSLCRELVRQKHGAGVVDRALGSRHQVQARVNAAQLRGLDEAVEDRGYLRAALGSGAEVVLSAEDHSSECALGSVVVDLDVRVFEECREALPVLEHVVDRFAQTALRKAALRERPRLQGLEQRSRLRITLLRAQGERGGFRLAVELIGARECCLDLEELADLVESLGAGDRVVRLGLEKLAPSMRLIASSE
jgi:hypothetical protein